MGHVPLLCFNLRWKWATRILILGCQTSYIMFDIATYIVTSCYIHILKVIWPNVWSFNYHLAARLARGTWIPEGHFHRYQVLLLQICGISLVIMLLNTIGCTSTQYNSIDSSTTLTSTTQRSDSSIPTITSRYPLCYLHLLLLSPVFLGSFKHHPIVNQAVVHLLEALHGLRLEDEARLNPKNDGICGCVQPYMFFKAY
jgi:hypothetical protein